MLYERVEGTQDPDLAGVLIEQTREKGRAVLAICPLNEGECVVMATRLARPPTAPSTRSRRLGIPTSTSTPRRGT
jgi:hypothetical protein